MRIIIALMLWSFFLMHSHAQGIDPNALSWETCSICSEPPNISVNESSVVPGNIASSESDSQSRASHFASAPNQS